MPKARTYSGPLLPGQTSVLRKPRGYKKGKSYGKKSTKSTKSLIQRELFKMSETKKKENSFNEKQWGSQTGNIALRPDGSNDTNANKLPTQGDGPDDRDGNSVAPIGWFFKGHMKIQGSTSEGDNRVSLHRVVCCEVKNSSTINNDLSDPNLIMGPAGIARGIYGDVRDIYADFNWDKTGKPFYDRVFRMKAGDIDREFNPTTGAITSVGSTPANVVFLDIKKFYKPTKKLSTDETSDAWWNGRRGNITMMIMARNANDDTALSGLNSELSGRSKFLFKDM